MAELENTEPNEELDEFTELTRKLLTISKEELDAERKRETKPDVLGVPNNGTTSLN